MNKLFQIIRNYNFESILDKSYIIISSIFILSIGVLGWVPLLLTLQYFSTVYFIYLLIFKALTNIPGFAIINLMFVKLIEIFPIIDSIIKALNPFYN
jgi:hypothetical protein|tara:strand:+ start:337 stop:627 length:291 start_codon:yes stop_codon:yes gene_type:complete